MTRVRVVHTTTYHYAEPVQFTPHRLMLRPRDSHDLRLIGATLTLNPPAVRTRYAHDVFSNSVAYVDFGDSRSDTLSFVSTLDLEHFPSAVELPVDPQADMFPFSYAAEEAPDVARLVERHYPDPDRKIDAWAHGFLRAGGETRTMELLTAMTEAVKSDFTYEARDAEGTNTPLDTLTARRGACRDFALLMMEAVRSLGMAARFVSGYLYDESLVNSSEPVVGGGATHAWVSVYLPGAGWVEFDPTNGLIAGHNLIRVCVARTPEQAVPIGGGFIGAGNAFTGMNVDVEVSVGRAAMEAAEHAEPAAAGRVPEPA